MLDYFNNFLNRTPKSSSLYMGRLNSYLDGLESGNTTIVERNARFTIDPIPSNGIDYINSMIVRADIPHILKFDDDVDRLRAIHREYRTPVFSDFIRQSPMRRRNFVGGQMVRTAEFILITDDFNITDELPLGENLDSWLQAVKPLRLLDHDSLEIRQDVVTSKLRFNYEPPNQAVFSLNIVKLLALYSKYRLSHPEEFVERVNNFPFIFKACINPLLQDSLRVYMINIIFDLLEGKLRSPDYIFDTGKILHGTYSSFIRANRDSAISELQNIFDKCADSKIKPDELLVTIKIDSKQTLYEYIQWILDSHYIGSGGNQFTWVEFIMQYKIMSIMMMLYSLQPDSVRSRDLCRIFRRYSKVLANTRFWAHARNPIVAGTLKSNFDHLNELCNR